MKIIQLPDDDFQLLNAAYAACEDARKALDKAHKASGAADDDYRKLCAQLAVKHKFQQDVWASDDQRYLYGLPLKAEVVDES